MTYTEKWQPNPPVDTAIDFTFPYIKESDVKVELNGTLLSNSVTTKYSQQTTSITLLSTYFTGDNALASSDVLRIYRDTDSDNLSSTFYPGSAIRSSDLNDNFTQSLYTAQESAEDAKDALRATDAFIATTSDEGATWVTAGNNTNASTDPKGVGYAVTTSEAANAKAVSTELLVHTYVHDGTNLQGGGSPDGQVEGVKYAVDKAVAADSAATAATNTANAAKTQAESAESAVSSVLPYTIVANKAALLSASVTQDDIYEVTDTTDLEDLGGTPAGSDLGDVIWVNAAGLTSGQDIATLKPDVTWDSGITLKMKKYGTNNTDRKWIFQNYFANDPEAKYAPTASPTFTGTVAIPNIANVETAITAKAPLADPDFTGVVDTAGQLNINSDAGLFIGQDIYIRRDSGTDKNYIECTHADEHDLVIEVQDGKSITLQTDDGSFGYETLALFQGDGAAELYHNGNKKIETTSAGVTVTGTVTATAGVLGVGDAVLATNQQWTGSQYTDLNTVTAASTTAFDFNLGNNFYIDMATAAITTINASNPNAGQSGSIIIKGHGSNTMAGWNAVYKFSGGTAPTITADATKYDRIDYYIYATDKIHMVWSGNY